MMNWSRGCWLLVSRPAYAIPHAEAFLDMYEGIEMKLDDLLNDTQGSAIAILNYDKSPNVSIYPSWSAPLVSKVRSAESRIMYFMRNNGSKPTEEAENFMSIAFNHAAGVYDNKMVMSKRAWKELYRDTWHV